MFDDTLDDKARIITRAYTELKRVRKVHDELLQLKHNGRGSYLVELLQPTEEQQDKAYDILYSEIVELQKTIEAELR